MEQNIDEIYLYRPAETDNDTSTWVYFRVTASGDEGAGDGQFEACRVTWPQFVDIPDNSPGDLPARTPIRIGYESAEEARIKFLQGRYGIDHDTSVLIGTLGSLPRRS